MNPSVLTRRGWILRLGGAAVLKENAAASLGAAERPSLPPGLYEPSLQHLAHALRAAGVAPSEPLPARYFGSEDFSLLRTLVAVILGEDVSAPVISEIAAWLDMIVGRSEEVRAAASALSPAHRRLAFDYYGEEIVRQIESEDPQALCRNGMAGLNRSGFAGLDTAGQVAHLVSLENANDPFLVWIKRRTLDGFYTSRQGLQELDYKGNAAYAQSPGCDHESGSR